MAFRLDKKQQAKVAELSTELSEKAGSVEEAITAYNDTVRQIRELRDELVADWQEQIDNKSEKWREGDAGSAATSLKDEWEGADFDDVDAPTMDHQETLDGLPTEAS